MRIALDLLLAGAVSAALAGILPSGDPLQSTLLLVPWIVAALAAVARRPGLLDPNPHGGYRELSATGVVVLVALSRRALGFALADELVIAALALVLVLHLRRRVPSLRPLLGSQLPRRPDPVFFVLPWLVYVAILPWSAQMHPPDGDEPFYLLLTHSLAEDFDVDLSDEYRDGASLEWLDRRLEPQPGDPVGPEGQLYSRHNLPLPLLLAPAYALAGRAGALVVMTLLTALLAWWTLRFARFWLLDRPGAALLAWAVFAFSPPLLLYSYQLWVEVPAALLSLIALDSALAGRKAPTRGLVAWSWRLLPIVLLPLLKIRFMLLAIPLALLTWWHAGRPRRASWIGGGLVGLTGLGILAHNQLTYGNPLKIHRWQELDPFRYPFASYLSGASGLFFDCAFGLFATAPIWLILAAALVPLIRQHRSLLWLGLFVAGPYLLVVVPRLEWFGGWSPPFRYPLVILPLLAVALAFAFDRRRGAGARALVAGLGSLTVMLGLLWVAHPGWSYNFADGRSYLLDHLGVRFGTDVVALFPSSTRVRTATWLWPLLSLPATALLWWRVRRVRRGAAGWGVALMLFAVASVPWLAARLPTRVLEFEDAHVKKTGGHVHPFRWIIERPHYPGGWVLREGESLSAPVVPAGEELDLRLYLRYVRNGPTPLTLELRADETRIALWEAKDPDGWQWLEIDPVPWPAGARLVLAVHGPPGVSRTNGVIVDRGELTWH